MIEGTVRYHNVETGFWGIVSDDGSQWMIINMPEQLKYEGRRVKVSLEALDMMSVSMWGTPARLLRFQTIEH